MKRRLDLLERQENGIDALCAEDKKSSRDQAESKNMFKRDANTTG